jgi:hypothetical protein
MSKKEPTPARPSNEFPMVGGPLDGRTRTVRPGESRVYIVGVRPEVYDSEVGFDSLAELFRHGVYELHKDYQRRDVLRWIGWEEEVYERLVIDNQSPDYHG